MENEKEIEKDLLVDELLKISEEGEIGKCLRVKKLQEINKKLLREYLICIGEFTIEPLLIEAYYCNPHVFEDNNVHGYKKQKNRFGRFYFHEKGRRGVDVCLSNGEYCLSFLIKNSLIRKDNEILGFFRQTQIYNLLIDFKDSEKFVLKKREVKKDAIVLDTVRKGLVKTNDFKTYKLAAVTGFELKDKNKKRFIFDLETGYGKETLIKDYIKKHPKELTESEFKEKFLDYVPKEIKESGLK